MVMAASTVNAPTSLCKERPLTWHSIDLFCNFISTNSLFLKVKVQKIVQKYRKDAIGKLVADGITPTKYEEVLTAARNSPMLRRQIMEAAGSIQKK